MTKDILYVVDENDVIQSVQLSLAAWQKVEAVVLPLLTPASQPKGEELKPEPLADWELLQQYWDYKYPVNHQVQCALCGAQTENWLQDEPRKFWLKAATLGGLLTYQCMGCRARVNKRLYKKDFSFDATPYFDSKDDRHIGVYGADQKKGFSGPE